MGMTTGTTTTTNNRRQWYRQQRQQPSRLLWIDTDVGFDDVVALKSLQAHGMSIDLITTVCGMNSASVGAHCIQRFMMPPDQVTAAAAAAAAVVPVGASPNRRQTTKHDWIPSFRQRFQDFVNQYGDNSDEKENEEYNIACHLESARQLLEDSKDNSVDLICLGPLSNLADCLEAYPNLLSSKLSSVWILGGSHPDRNIDEFNFGQDPVAANRVISSPLLQGKIYLVPGEQTSYNRVASSKTYTETIVQAAEHASKNDGNKNNILSRAILADPNYAIYFDPICCFVYHQHRRNKNDDDDNADIQHMAADFDLHRISVCPNSGKTLSGPHAHWIASSVIFDNTTNTKQQDSKTKIVSYKEWILSAIQKTAN